MRHGKAFRWIAWNVDHIAEHGIDPEEAESIVKRVEHPFPLKRGDEKWLAMGADQGGRLLQVVYLLDPDGTVFVIHARPLTEREKRSYRRNRR